jgi:2-hydroxychromene-2-carboxylate isomerase
MSNVAILGSQDAIAQLESLTQETFNRGAFGVPTFFVGEEMFRGNHRLVLLVHHLKKLK